MKFILICLLLVLFISIASAQRGLILPANDVSFIVINEETGQEMEILNPFRQISNEPSSLLTACAIGGMLGVGFGALLICIVCKCCTPKNAVSVERIGDFLKFSV